MKRLKVIVEWGFLALMVLLCGMVLLAGSGNVPYIFGHRILQVISHSMEPTIQGETCIVIKKVEQEEIQVGDIITFVSEEGNIKGYLNTHRVHDIVEDAETGETLYITKGDAYESADSLPVQYEQVAGRYVGELPFGALLFKSIRFLTDRDHYFLIVILPLALCFMSYAKDLYEAVFLKHRKKDDDDEEDAEDEGVVNTEAYEEEDDDEEYEVIRIKKKTKKKLAQTEIDFEEVDLHENNLKVKDLEIEDLEKTEREKE